MVEKEGGGVTFNINMFWYKPTHFLFAVLSSDERLFSVADNRI